MSVDKLKALQEEKGRIITEQRSVIDAAEKDGRMGFNADEQAKFDKHDADIRSIDSKISFIQREEADKRAIATAEEKGREEARSKEAGKDTETARKAAFDSYLRHGISGMTAEERSVLGNFKKATDGTESRAQSAASGGAGGYLVAREFSNELDTALKAFGGMLELGRIWTTGNGAVVDWPTVDDTAVSGRILSAGTDATTGSTDLSFGSKTIGAYTYTSDVIKVDNALIQDSAFNLSSLIAEAMATRFGRIQNTHYTVGTGSSQPEGVVVGATAVTGVAAVSALTADNILDLIHSVNRAYRKGAKLTFNDLTEGAIRKLKDSQGRYIWAMGDMQKGSPASIFGFEYVVNDDIASIGVSTKSVGFGDFSRYIIRTVEQPLITRLTERFAEFNQTAFVGFMRTDAKLLNAGAVKFLQHAAS